LVPLKQITVTQYFLPLTGIGKNHATATQTATKLNRRAVTKNTVQFQVIRLPALQVN
jgi:hypothetical protein